MISSVFGSYGISFWDVVGVDAMHGTEFGALFGIISAFMFLLSEKYVSLPADICWLMVYWPFLEIFSFFIRNASFALMHPFEYQIVILSLTALFIYRVTDNAVIQYAAIVAVMICIKHKSRKKILFLLFVLTLGLSLLQETPWSILRFLPSEYKTLASTTSVTGLIQIIDVPEPCNCRLMRAGHSLIGGIYLDTHESIFGSFYLMEVVGKVVDVKKALVIGLGVGISLSSLKSLGVAVDVVEIDPAVYYYARDYFNAPLPDEIHIQDGRHYLEHAEAGKYDAVLHDVFTGGSVPHSLFTVEALDLIKNVLRKNGLLALNYVGMLQNEGFDIVVSTLKQVFPRIRCFAEKKYSLYLQNFVFFASEGNINIAEFSKHDYLESSMRELVFSDMKNNEIDLGSIEMRSSATDSDDRLKNSSKYLAKVHWKAMRNLFPRKFWVGV